MDTPNLAVLGYARGMSIEDELFSAVTRVADALPETVAVRFTDDPADTITAELADPPTVLDAWMNGVGARVVIDVMDTTYVSEETAWLYVWVAVVAHSVCGAPMDPDDIRGIAAEAIGEPPETRTVVPERRRYGVGDIVALPKSIVKPGLWRDKLVAPAGARGVITRAPRFGRLYDVLLDGADGQTIAVWADEIVPAPAVMTR